MRSLLERIDNVLSQSEQDAIYNTWLPKIEKQCSEIVSVYKKNKRCFFRGMMGNKYNDILLELTPPKNRKPRSTVQKYHDEWNDLWVERFGWKARSEGVFVVADDVAAEYYGDLIVFFPVNGWTAYWSPFIEDSYLEYPSDYLIDTYNEGQLDKYFSRFKTNEVIFKCKKYFGWPIKYFTVLKERYGIIG